MLSMRRIAAYLIDLAIVGVYIGLLVAVGLLIIHMGRHAPVVDSNVRRALAQLGASLVLTLPTTFWLAVWEYRAHATPGKRVMGLTVVTNNGSALSFRQALLRSSVKVLIPWELAHAAVWRLVTIHGPGPDVTTYVLLGFAYLIVLADIVLLFSPARRLLHDRMARTLVRDAAMKLPHDRRAVRLGS